MRPIQGHGQPGAASRGPKTPFGTVWRLFGVHHGGILVPWGHLDFRVFGRPEVIFGRPDRPRATPLRQAHGSRRLPLLCNAALRKRCLASNVTLRTPIVHEERSLLPVGASEVRRTKDYKGSCDQARATGSQAPPPGAQKIPFGTVWWLFGVHHGGILVPWGHLDFRVFGRPEVIFGRPDHPWGRGGRSFRDRTDGQTDAQTA